MKKYILSIYTLAALCVGTMGVTSCSDPDDVKDLVLDRVLSPTTLSARISENVNIVVSWDAMKGATTYEIEAYADAPDYDQRPADVTGSTTETEYTLTGLLGETDYYIRVRAVDGENSNRNSKWSELKRTTNPEQNMNKAKAGDIHSKSVRVTWTAGITVDALKATPTSANSSATEVTQTLTADEIAAGAATIEGLQPETSYRITLKYGSKTRGYTTVITNIDMDDATVITPDDDWITAIQSAPAGSKIALAPGEYKSPDTEIVISNNIIIGAQNSGNMPVINSYFKLYGGASLFLYQVVLEGTDTGDDSGVQAVDYKDPVAYGSLTFKGCEIRNYVKGLIYINVAAVVDKIEIDNCIIHDIVCNGGDLFDCRKGAWNSFNLTNSTIYNSAKERDIFRMDDASTTVSAAPVTNIDKCTFYNVGYGKKTYRFFYIRFKGNSNSLSNTVIVNFNNTRGFGNSSATAMPTLSNNYYYNCENLTSQAEGNTQTGLIGFDVEGKILEENPFKDPDNGDFTVTDEIYQSFGFGDPRWLN